MQNTQKHTCNFPEGIYWSRYLGAYAYILYNEDTNLPMCSRILHSDTELQRYVGFSTFHQNSVFANGLHLIISCTLPDNVIISDFYPELFI